MNRLSYIFLPLTAIGMSACSSGKEEVKRPNIIFMMTDDHTTQAMSCYGGRFLQTPNMDRIANEGVRTTVPTRHGTTAFTTREM